MEDIECLGIDCAWCLDVACKLSKGVITMKWLTEKSRLEQSEEVGKWILLDNELFLDEDGTIYITPRNFITDNFTIPDWIAWLGGNKSKYDVRSSHLHDFGCFTHSLLVVNLTEQELIEKGYLRRHKNKIVCEDIPAEYLSLVPVTKWEVDCLFKRAMKATYEIPARIYNLYRCGVFFNVGWILGHIDFDMNKIYTIEQNYGIEVME